MSVGDDLAIALSPPRLMAACGLVPDPWQQDFRRVLLNLSCWQADRRASQPSPRLLHCTKRSIAPRPRSCSCHLLSDSPPNCSPTCVRFSTNCPIRWRLRAKARCRSGWRTALAS